MLKIIIEPETKKKFEFTTELPEQKAIKFINLFKADTGTKIILEKNRQEIYRRELKYQY
jgi:hypothetical protein